MRLILYFDNSDFPVVEPFCKSYCNAFGFQQENNNNEKMVDFKNGRMLCNGFEGLKRHS